MKLALPAVFAAALGAIALAAPAQAATSCYGGASLGFSAASTPVSLHDHVAGDSVPFGDMDGTGVSGGLTAGCDWRKDSWLIGGWGDITWQNTDLDMQFFGISVMDVSIERQWSLGARAGYFVADNILLYGLIGWTRVETSDFSLGSESVSVDGMNGVVLGGGVEFEIAPNIALATEYRYTHLGDETAVLEPGVASADLEPEIHTARAILKYKFDIAR